MTRGKETREEIRAISTRDPNATCKHVFGSIEPGRYARWVRRCKRCRAVATIRLTQE